jgi:hypothetical protein
MGDDLGKSLGIVVVILAIFWYILEIGAKVPIYSFIVNALGFPVPVWAVIIVVVSLVILWGVSSKLEKVNPQTGYSENHIKNLLDHEMSREIVLFCQQAKTSHEISSLVEKSRYRFNSDWLSELEEGALNFDPDTKTWTSTQQAIEVLVKYYGVKFK